MGHLFLDIETYAARDSDSAMNPYLPDSKVLVIAYNYYENKDPPVREDIKKPVLLMEWHSGEKAVLTQFLSILKNIREKDRELKLHGFNVLSFDLPYLFGRMRFHNIADDKALHAALFKTAGYDVMQLGLLLSNSLRQKEQLWNILPSETNRFFSEQLDEGLSEEMSRLYDRQDYGEITKRCRDQFVFEQLLNAFYLYAQRLAEGL